MLNDNVVPILMNSMLSQLSYTTKFLRYSNLTTNIASTLIKCLVPSGEQFADAFDGRILTSIYIILPGISFIFLQNNL